MPSIIILTHLVNTRLTPLSHLMTIEPTNLYVTWESIKNLNRLAQWENNFLPKFHISKFNVSNILSMLHMREQLSFKILNISFDYLNHSTSVVETIPSLIYKFKTPTKIEYIKCTHKKYQYIMPFSFLDMDRKNVSHAMNRPWEKISLKMTKLLISLFLIFIFPLTSNRTLF